MKGTRQMSSKIVSGIVKARLLQLGLVLAAAVPAAASAEGQQCSDLIKRANLLYDRVERSEPLRPEQINYKVFGPKDAKKTIVLVHGLGSSMNTWREVVPELAKQYRVIVYDQRSHGRSAMGENDYSTEIAARDLKVLLDHLGESKVHLIGHSLGARVSMKFLELYPDQVLSFISEDMDARQVQDTAPGKVDKILSFAEIARGLKKETYSSFDEIAQELYYGAFKDELDADKRLDKSKKFIYRLQLTKEYEKGLLIGKPKVKAIHVDRELSAARILYGFMGNADDFGPALKKSRQPMMFIRANPEESPFFPEQGVAHIKANKPDARIILVKKAEHTIHGGDTLATYLELITNFHSVN
jgi:pimeloyl-ACP methyl ester carboxylesterase